VLYYYYYAIPVLVILDFMAGEEEKVEEEKAEEPEKKTEEDEKAETKTETKAAAEPSAVTPRLDNTTASLPIVSGSVAFYLGKKADEYQTHEWTLYLRGPRNEDLSVAIAKVIFHLHPSFAQSVRELTEPPYEVTERGWGEFEAQIKIEWKDPTEHMTMVSAGSWIHCDLISLQMSQPIKLYPAGAPPNTEPSDPGTPVVYEIYDEVVFTDPTESFFQQLQKVARAPVIKYTHELHFPEYDDKEDMKALLEAKQFLEEELTLAKERLKQVDGDLMEVDEALRQQHEQRKAASAAASASSRPKAQITRPSSAGSPTKRPKA